MDQMEYRAAMEALRQAQQNFDQADRDHVDIAIADLMGAEWRVGQALRELRAYAG